ncbi:DoxX family membrane protein [Halospeciosus flavus]|uniref:DoxX family membrane protein n=1 Tax=Halospeciosus flavus TaxID=3032283 RepID=A0ABD5Z6C6_9EURY|nr:DoxX family membrane protein [Halospeciosus flavus]
MIRRLVYVLARAAFGAKFARDGYENLTDIDDIVEFADGAGVPYASVLVPAASLLLLVGGILLALGIAPILGVIAIATFLLGVTPEMHDFWHETGEERTEEFDSFLRNIAFLGAAVAFWLVSRRRGQTATKELPVE